MLKIWVDEHCGNPDQTRRTLAGAQSCLQTLVPPSRGEAEHYAWTRGVCTALCLSTCTGAVRRACTGGLCVSKPDRSRSYVAESRGGGTYRMEVSPAGCITPAMEEFCVAAAATVHHATVLTWTCYCFRKSGPRCEPLILRERERERADTTHC